MKNRDYFYDLVRCVCVVWIIGVWHMTNYFPESSSFKTLIVSKYGDDITTIVLASFTLISGLFLNKYTISDRNDFLLFYMKRFQRFYVLFIFSCFTLYFTPFYYGSFFSSSRQLILSLFGLSCFIGKMPSTLWYMDMILVFYVLTPVLLVVIQKLSYKYKILLCLAIFSVSILLVTVNGKFHFSDKRILVYFPYYFIGLSIGANKFKFALEKYHVAVLGGAILIFLLGVCLRNFYFHFLYILSGVILLHVLCLLINKKLMNSALCLNAVELIGYASMTSYLFHRQLYNCFDTLSVPYWLWCAFAIIISYIIQLSYDRVLVKCKTA